jgi:probable HAF family extracellular repeat protein
MRGQTFSFRVSKGRTLTLFAALLTGVMLLCRLGIRPAETQTAPYYYEVQDLGTLPGGSSSYPSHINDSGKAVGCADTASGQYHAFLYKDGVMKDLDTLGGNNSCAYGVNNSGQVAGHSDTAPQR